MTYSTRGLRRAEAVPAPVRDPALWPHQPRLPHLPVGAVPPGAAPGARRGLAAARAGPAHSEADRPGLELRHPRPRDPRALARAAEGPGRTGRRRAGRHHLDLRLGHRLPELPPPPAERLPSCLP